MGCAATAFKHIVFMNPSSQHSIPRSWAPVLTLLGSAALWGTTWYPFRLLAARGIDGLWAVILTETVAVLVCIAIFRRQLALMRGWPLVFIGLLGGACNTGYVVGAVQGEVMRVTLLLYLSPLWTILFAHWLLGERIDAKGGGVIALSLAGALTMLWPGREGLNFTAPDAWGLMAGVCYAGFNVLVRRHLELPVAHKTFAGAAGCVVVSAVLLPFFGESSAPNWGLGTFGLILGLGMALVLIVVLMQYGLERMAASRSIVILVSELVFATASAWWLAGEVPRSNALLGGGLIVAACLLSALVTPTPPGDDNVPAK